MGLGDEPEVEGGLEGAAVAIEFVPGRQSRKGVFEDGGVFGTGEGLDVEEGLAQRRREAGGGLELGGQGGAVLLEIERFLGGQEGGGFVREALFVVFKKADEHGSIDEGQLPRVSKEGQHKV